MFENIGGKIKGLAIVICALGMIASVIFAVRFWLMSRYNSSYILLGFGILAGGCLASWISVFFIYGFGQLIENSDEIREDMEYLRSRQNPRPAIKSGWKCSGCGKINSPEDDYCECGLSKWD